jgi:hypothetical protein
MIRQTMSLRGPVGSGHSTPGTAAEKLNAFSPVGVQQSHMNSFKMETTAKKYVSMNSVSSGWFDPRHGLVLVSVVFVCGWAAQVW